MAPFQEVASDVDSILAGMRNNPANVRFADACKVADHFFGPPRHVDGSHRIWKMNWAGNPRVNMQDDGGKAKPYQVRQLLEAIDNHQMLQAEKAAKRVPEEEEKKAKNRRKRGQKKGKRR